MNRRLAAWLVAVSAAVLALPLQAINTLAGPVAGQQLRLAVLLVGEPAPDATTQAWQTLLSSEGVPYTLVMAAGTLGAQTLTLPTLQAGSVGNFEAVVFADTPADFAPGQLTALDTYEADFGIRQLDGYVYPSAALGLTAGVSGEIGGTVAQLTPAGLADFPALKGPVPIDTGTYGYGATVNAGVPFTPLLTSAAGDVLGGIYRHPATDPQAGVQELALTFNYNAYQLQWLVLGPNLVDWVTGATHLGLYRNYFGMDVDDVFISDNEWSSLYQCTPAATDPPDYTCPPGVAGNPADGPPDTQMTAADVAYVANWEQQTGITLDMVFNGLGACTEPSPAEVSAAVCDGRTTVGGTTYTDPGLSIDPTMPSTAAMVNQLLQDQASFNWITHTWSHQFLGCQVWQPQPLGTAAANATGGALTAGTYGYVITAATAYGESEPSAAQTVDVSAGGSATLTWPDAPNGGGPTLAQLAASFQGGSGFWGYDIYRQNPGQTTYYLVGQVAEDPSGTTATYTFTDTGAAAQGAPVPTDSTFPTATDPGIDCASSAAWLPAASTPPAESIGQEIGMDDAFAVANHLANWSPSTLVTGEFSGLENPNLPAALAATQVTTIAADASRQPNQYGIPAGSTATLTAPRVPSNIYYNASNWPDEVSEYNTLYASPSVEISATAGPGGTPEYGHCVASPTTTCLTTAATEASILTSESRIMLGRVLANNPRVGYAHQSNLIGPAPTGYTLLSLIDSMLSQYTSWYSAPLAPVTDATDAQILGQQAAWATTQAAGTVTATAAAGVLTLTNTAAQAATVPVTVPLGSTSAGQPFGTPYGSGSSSWVTLGAGQSLQVALGTAAQTITFTSTPPAAGQVGGAYLAAATSSSGLPVTFSADPASTACTVSPTGAVEFTAVGTCRIDADQAGSALFAPAPQVSETITVVPAGGTPQTITFTSAPPAAPQVGDTYQAAASSSSGLPVTFSADPAGTACTVTATGQVAFTALGLCRIDANQAGSALFAPAPQVSQSLTVVEPGGGGSGPQPTPTPIPLPMPAPNPGHHTTATTLALSAARATYGAERRLRITATVRGLGTSATPGGTVRIQAGSTTLCRATLAGGRATCSAARDTLLPAGRVTLRATYSGGPTFSGSSSAAQTLQVLRASTRTRLTLAVHRVVHGREAGLRVSVRVQGVGVQVMPAGTAVVRSGATTLCTVRVTQARGSCTVRAPGALAVGHHRVTATYRATANLLGSTSGAGLLTVVRPQTGPAAHAAARGGAPQP